MSVREYVVNYLGGSRSPGGAAGGAPSNSSGATGSHRLDGPEHQPPVDGTRLDASATAHGLLRKLSGVATNAMRGDGTWADVDVSELVTSETDTTLVAAPDGAGGVTFVIAPSGSLVPYFIAPGDTFVVPLYSQALYSMPIDNEGLLDVVGFLIEVD